MLLILLVLAKGPGELLYAQSDSTKVGKEANLTNGQTSADSLFNLGEKYLNSQRYEQSLSLFQKSINRYALTNNHKKIGDCFNYIAVINYFQGDYYKTIFFFKKSIESYKKSKYKKGVASLLNNIGSVYNTSGDYLKALDYYRQAIVIFEEVGEKENLAVATRNIGLIYMEGNDYKNAMDHFRKSYAIHRKLNNRKNIGETLIPIGKVYAKEGRYDSAFENLTKALQIADEERDKQLQISALASLGDLFYGKSDYNRALPYYTRCLTYANEVGRLQYQSESQIAIGSIMHKLGRNKSSIVKCQDGLRLAEKLGSMSQKKSGCDCLYQAHKSLGNNRQALRYYEQANAYEDSLNLAETSNRIMGMEFQKQQLVDSIAYVKKEYAVKLSHKEDVRRREKNRNLIAISLCFVLLIAAGLWNRLAYTRKAKSALQIEKDRSETLLLNILPEEIAEELKEKGNVSAQDYDLVSILFTDFKSFTETAEKMTPQSLVEEINICFKAFDLITEKYQIEKIKTIGDAYMAAGGIPKAHKDSARNIVLAGLEMQAFIKDRALEGYRTNRPAFEMRLGIHIGPIVAGIVGVRKFQYDVWGDTVNTASRMESSGMVGKVNISEALYQIIKDEDCFSFEYRGYVHAKGKGEAAMYFVEKCA
ncbi:adenylate/guanylate cyclase domain-containing protein [Hymenobacter rigui]|uniref:Tetratricopeptide repeat protein n=1 Tax=Hymenobacter rigui TaxID=334424 RepID=A0A428KM90_9BACT|nr:adenylate/guanylate cyclase domain-containing protein [Hymenobacter rigui]RSK47560.1 tetratricopeptide repeat protein [Hymenobacter rigui]